MIHFPDMDPSSGDLVLERDTGLCWRKHGDEPLEPLGFIGDESNCPPDLEGEWAELADWWREAAEHAKACYATATYAYYYGINPAHWN